MFSHLRYEGKSRPVYEPLRIQYKCRMHYAVISIFTCLDSGIHGEVSVRQILEALKLYTPLGDLFGVSKL
jgi:hypothetical protein